MKRLLTIILIIFPLHVSADFISALSDYNAGNYKQAYYEFKKLAEVGEKRAQFNLGVMYYNGQYVEQDIYTGYAWLKLAVESDAIDQKLKQVFKSVTGQIDDLQRAEQIYKKLASEYSTGMLLETLYPALRKPEGAYASKAKPIQIVEPKWPRKALRNGMQGRVRVGFELDKKGIPRNITLLESLPKGVFDGASLNAVRKWIFEPPRDENGNLVNGKYMTYLMDFRIKGNDPIEVKKSVLKKNLAAARAGDAKAQFMVALWEDRIGLDEVDNANEWYLKSAVQGVPLAQFEIGKSMVFGHGCLAEPEKGIEWLNRAAGNGEQQSKLLLGRLLSQKDDLKSQLQAKTHFGDIDKIPPRSLLAYLWMLVKSPHAEIADPELAIELLDDLSSKNYRDDITPDEIKAAAYAAMDDWRRAVIYQKDAIEEAEDISADTTKLLSNLELYKQQKRWF